MYHYFNFVNKKVRKRIFFVCNSLYAFSLPLRTLRFCNNYFPFLCALCDLCGEYQLNCYFTMNYIDILKSFLQAFKNKTESCFQVEPHNDIDQAAAKV